jgi:pimeloyl-ACP methyl ester carboxylesterase
MQIFDIHAIAKKYIWNIFTKNDFVSKVLDIEKYTIEFWDNDNGKEVLLLLHGFGAQTEFQWYKQIQILGRNYRVIVPNLLYFGQSKPVYKDEFELENQVEMISCLINYLKIADFQLAGISYGGLVGMEYYRQHKSKVKKLLLIDSPVKYLTTDDLDNICKKYDAVSIIEFFAPKHSMGLKKQIQASYYQKMFIPSFILKNFFDKLCLPNIDNWENLILSLLSKKDYYEKLVYKTDCPVLLIWGEYDDIIPLRIGKQLEAYFDNSTLEIIPKSKHLPNLENAKLVNHLILKFLKTDFS